VPAPSGPGERRGPLRVIRQPRLRAGAQQPFHHRRFAGPCRERQRRGLVFGVPRVDVRDVIIAVTADHATPCSLKAHSDDPVPLLVSGGGVKPDGTHRYTEREAASGDLGTLAGVDIMPLLAGLANS